MSKVISVEKEKTNVSQLNRSNRSINLNLHTQNCTGKEKIVASLSCQFTSISGIAAHWHSTVFLVLKVGKNKKGSDGEGKQKWWVRTSGLPQYILFSLAPIFETLSSATNANTFPTPTRKWSPKFDCYCCCNWRLAMHKNKERERKSQSIPIATISGVCGNINKSRCTSWFRYI